jgi:hypothetical protein
VCKEEVQCNAFGTRWASQQDFQRFGDLDDDEYAPGPGKKEKKKIMQKLGIRRNVH